MSLGSIRADGREIAVHVDSRGVVPVEDLVPGLGDVMDVIASGRYGEVRERASRLGASALQSMADVSFGPPYRRPRMIWGIGLNYREHAGDLSENVPQEPASFIKADHTIIGPADPIPIPRQSVRTTAEAEIGLVIGRTTRNVSQEDALEHVFGVVTVLDQTAEDILERNPRFLTRSKNFPGFFSFGPLVTPLDELDGFRADLGDVEVRTVINGSPHRSNTVDAMTFSPAYLVSMHSEVMPLSPGDVISTGTPGAVHVRAGDIVTCEVPGIGSLTNPVVDQA